MPRFEVLGSVRAWCENSEIDLGTRQSRAVLALLLVRSGRPVGQDELVDLLWPDYPPKSASNVVYRTIGELRRRLEPGLPVRSTGRWIVGRAGGYMMNTDPTSLDLLEFRELAAQGKQASVTGDAPEAVSLLSRALRLWNGPCASGIQRVSHSTVAFTTVDNEYLHAVDLGAQAAIACGRPDAMLPFLQESALRDDLNERVHARLISALGASGRQAQAFKVYQRIRRNLAAELGVEPGTELREAYADVLRAEPPRVHLAPDLPTESEPLVRPAQLPADLPTFAGREDETARLTSIVEAAVDDRQGVSIMAVDGMAGVGKTTLAVHVAHRLKGRFPDGQLYVDLNGFAATGGAMSPDNALRSLLSSLGIPHGNIPGGVDEKSALYRSLLTGRHVLILLDNARDVEQVKPLLPGSPGSAAVVTSRYQLTGLAVSHGAQMTTLSPPSLAAARTFLARRIGAGRMAAEPEAADAIIAHSGHLPLAMAIVAGRAMAHPEFRLADIVDELRRSRGSLDAFAVDISADARSCFSWSYQLLSPDAARLFRLMSLRCGTDISIEAAGSLLGVPVARAGTLMRELKGTGLVMENRPRRFTVHDLVDAYARELCLSVDDDAIREAAVGRLLDHYLHSALAAQRLLQPYREPVRPGPVAPGVTPEVFRDYNEALTWLARERAVMGVAIELAAKSTSPVPAWRLALAMQQLYHWHGYWQEWADTMQLTLSAARESGDVLGQAHSHRSLAGACFLLGRRVEALSHLGAALCLFGELGSVPELGYVHGNFAEVYAAQGNLDKALEHFGQALSLFRDAGIRLGEASTLCEIGRLDIRRRAFDRALRFISQSVALSRELGLIRQEADSHSALGRLYREMGNRQSALESLGTALSLLRNRGHHLLEAEILIPMGELQWEVGDVVIAAQTWSSAGEVLEKLDIPRSHELRQRLARMTGGRPGI